MNIFYTDWKESWDIMVKELKGFIETEDGLDRIHLVFSDYGEYEGAWMNDDLLDYEADTFEHFLDEYGSVYYETKEDYKIGNSKLFQDWETEQFPD